MNDGRSNPVAAGGNCTTRRSHSRIRVDLFGSILRYRAGNRGLSAIDGWDKLDACIAISIGITQNTLYSDR